MNNYDSLELKIGKDVPNDKRLDHRIVGECKSLVDKTIINTKKDYNLLKDKIQQYKPICKEIVSKTTNTLSKTLKNPYVKTGLGLSAITLATIVSSSNDVYAVSDVMNQTVNNVSQAVSNTSPETIQNNPYKTACQVLVGLIVLGGCAFFVDDDVYSNSWNDPVRKWRHARQGKNYR